MGGGWGGQVKGGYCVLFAAKLGGEWEMDGREGAGWGGRGGRGGNVKKVEEGKGGQGGGECMGGGRGGVGRGGEWGIARMMGGRWKRGSTKRGVRDGKAIFVE